MAAGFGELRLAPVHFWSMTPRELAAALGLRAEADVPPPSRALLQDLMHRFPDR